MGVYTELYAPILLINSMSQVTQSNKPNDQTTQPRLYKRGNDDIELDAFVRSAESEFSYWLANSRLKDKEKTKVQEAFSDMLYGIVSGDYTYNVGGGFNNTKNRTNASKGFDAYGLAAGFLGDILRSQSVYTAPTEEIDSSKIKWSGNTSIGQALTKRLFGSDTANVNDFVDLDLPDEKTKKRGNTNRSARFKAGLEYIRDNFDTLFTSFTDQDKMSAIENINTALGAFNNGTVEDNEYLDLGRATGISNLRDLFGPGQATVPSTPGGGAGGSGDGGGSALTEDEWRSINYPKIIVSLMKPMSLHDPAIYGSWSRQALDKHLKKLDVQTLFDLINYGLSGRNVQLYSNPKIVSYAGRGNNPVPFSNKYIINRILEILRTDKNALSGYADSTGNQYYIKDSYNKKRGTGMVWNMFDNSLNEVSIYDIPYWVTKMHNEYSSRVSSNKAGGILKFQSGGASNVKYGTDYSWDKIIFGSNQFANVLQGLNASNYEAANALQNRFSTEGINTNWNNGRLTPRDIIKAYQTDFNTAYGTNLNAGAIEDAISQGLITRVGNTGDNAAGNWADGYAGAMTNLRHLGTKDDVGRIEEMNKILNQNGLEAFLNEETGMINYRPWENPAIAERRAVVASTQSPSAVSEEELFGGSDSRPKEDPTDLSKILERYLPIQDVTPKTGGFGNFMANLAPDLVGAGRLWASLHTNNRVADTVRPTLKPVLKDTYERYSPITGAFSTMQLKNSQGAGVLSQSYRPFTSDASLAAARMLEGQRQANQLQTEGFLADDQEIRRTRAEALQRQEDNMARKPDVANFNRVSINQTNREVAQLEASRLKNNWQSWDNSLGGIEGRLRTRLTEDRERTNNFYDRILGEQSQNLYNEYKNQAYNSAQAWLKTQPAGTDITEWDQYPLYRRKLEEAQRRAQSILYSGMASRYGWSYNSPFTKESNDLFFTRGWNGRFV